MRVVYGDLRVDFILSVYVNACYIMQDQWDTCNPKIKASKQCAFELLASRKHSSLGGKMCLCS